MSRAKHKFVNPKADGGDATITRPSNWNDDHLGVYEVFNAVTDYAADPSGAADAAGAIQNALTAAGTGTTYLPAGTYKLSTSLILKGGNLIGAGTQASILKPTGQTFPAITNASTLHWFRVSSLGIDFVNANAGGVCTNPLAAGIAFLTAPNICGDFEIDNIWVSLAYYGFNDTATSYMFTLRNLHLINVNTGVSKTGNGTTITLQTVFVAFCVTGFNFNAQQSITMIGCAMQNTTGAGPFAVVSCHGFRMEGFDYEACAIPAGGIIFNISNCLGFSFSGVKGNGNTLAGANTAIINVNSAPCVGSFVGCAFGDSDTATGAGGDCSMIATNGAVVTFMGCYLTAPVSGAGAPTVRLGSCANTAGDAVVIINSTALGNSFDPGFKIFIAQSSGPWTALPAITITQNGARTFTTTYARYMIVGKTVTVQASFIITNAGTAGFGIAIGSWPAAIAPRQVGADAVCGTFQYNRAGTRYSGIVEANTALVLIFLRGGNADTASMGAAGGGNFATANGDVLSILLTYEAA